ncbi:hypothetical protein M153_3060008507 [Pseudoloma neurophilia]|uniref:BZIP domain-containing protein n=1 Tax=Pseudoloma neurophilia TaxID=146866 RepID=A0A0R0LYN6_9MICR|nr:hypothetical protein M153_3060008507 [Pseudoloma neurophilia]
MMTKESFNKFIKQENNEQDLNKILFNEKCKKKEMHLSLENKKTGYKEKEIICHSDRSIPLINGYEMTYNIQKFPNYQMSNSPTGTYYHEVQNQGYGENVRYEENLKYAENVNDEYCEYMKYSQYGENDNGEYGKNVKYSNVQHEKYGGHVKYGQYGENVNDEYHNGKNVNGEYHNEEYVKYEEYHNGKNVNRENVKYEEYHNGENVNGEYPNVELGKYGQYHNSEYGEHVKYHNGEHAYLPVIPYVQSQTMLPNEINCPMINYDSGYEQNEQKIKKKCGRPKKIKDPIQEVNQQNNQISSNGSCSELIQTNINFDSSSVIPVQNHSFYNFNENKLLTSEKNQEKSDVSENLSVNDKLGRKRLQNRLAARKSRLKKAAILDEYKINELYLNKEITELKKLLYLYDRQFSDMFDHLEMNLNKIEDFLKHSVNTIFIFRSEFVKDCFKNFYNLVNNMSFDSEEQILYNESHDGQEVQRLRMDRQKLDKTRKMSREFFDQENCR